ncbi:hypothetical protein ACQQ2N_04260 [Dokdonella sp. MW10]|uniref:hypothetical protein n=1 Tax=Dokdonella sp. MW10 TaxID=2992926 RepID=UPI003F8031A3
MKTIEVRELAREVLGGSTGPYSHHIIDEVFEAIEKDPSLRARYEHLCAILDKNTVNHWIGRWTAITLGKRGEQQVPSRLSTLIGSYSILDTDAKARKPDRTEALQLMSDYSRSNKASLPPHARDHREAILDLIMEGVPVEEAFAEALRAGA